MIIILGPKTQLCLIISKYHHPPTQMSDGLITYINTPRIVLMLITVSLYTGTQRREANEIGRQRNLRTVCVLNRARHDEA